MTHYEKYRDLSAKLHVRWNEDSAKRMLGISRKELTDKFQEDPHLNNIPLQKWDGIATSMQMYIKGLSLAEAVCLAKHCAIYHCIGAKSPLELGEEKEK